jgi:hypothetical protein
MKLKRVYYLVSDACSLYDGIKLCESPPLVICENKNTFLSSPCCPSFILRVLEYPPPVSETITRAYHHTCDSLSIACAIQAVPSLPS